MWNQNEDNTAWRRTLRQQMIALRQALPPAAHAEASSRIVEQLEKHFEAPRVVGFCWPIKQEPDVRAILPRWAATSGTRAALPVVIAEAQPLIFCRWDSETALENDRYGIPTPVNSPQEHPDLLLIPLNAFDAAGYRIGYGGGYFDRTLAHLKPRPLCIGIGFEMNRVPTIRPAPHDQALDAIVTDMGVWKISAACDQHA